MQELESLQIKLKKLLNEFQSLRVENIRLQKILSANENTIEAQKEKIKSLQNDLQKKMINENLPVEDKDKKEAFKKYLSEVIHQIDENIKLLKQ